MKFTLCGSARFEAEYIEWNRRLTLNGDLVFSLGAFPSQTGSKDWYTQAEKTVLDLVHLHKIMESDGILVINPGGYIGSSTRNEILWARFIGKDIYSTEAITPLDTCLNIMDSKYYFVFASVQELRELLLGREYSV